MLFARYCNREVGVCCNLRRVNAENLPAEPGQLNLVNFS